MSTILTGSPLPIHTNEATKDLLSSKLKQTSTKQSQPGTSPLASSTTSTTPTTTTSIPSLTPNIQNASNTSTSTNTLTSSVANLSISPRSQEVAFKVPKKRIISNAHLERFKQSQSFDEILAFIATCNEAVVGKKLRDDDIYTSQAVTSILTILSRISALVKSTPPESGSSSRFGNPAFRTLYSKIKDSLKEILEIIPGLESKSTASSQEGQEVQQEIGALEEIQIYFLESWGNEKRIDYGSGMELNFACWLLCLVKLGILDLKTDSQAIVLKVFWSYISVMREIQSTYWLEPAGSHGVWGLDDYHFLPFLWGSAQLRNHKHLRPKSIHDEEIMEEVSPDYMYFACIRFINSIKTASLRWHSPMLDDISGVKTWSKVNEGMIKMYKAEVLNKLPIAQHIFFGSLLPYPISEDEDHLEDGEELEDEHGHIHSKNKEGQAAGWGDCCGIPIPSVFAAANEEKERLKLGSGIVRGEKPIGAGGIRLGENVRRIPFD